MVQNTYNYTDYQISCQAENSLRAVTKEVIIMDKKKKRIITVAIVLIVLLVGLGTVIALAGENDTESTETTEQVTTEAIKEEKEPTTEVMLEEPTTETTVEEEPAIETTEAEDTGATQATTESPTKPETTEAPSASAQSATTEAPAPSAPTEPAPSAPTAPTTEEPKHEHNWVWVKTKDAWVETVVDKPAWTETKEHSEEYHWFNGFACHYCWQEFATSTEAKAHCNSYRDTDPYHVAAGYGSVSYKVVDKPAWTETIEHPAETHTVNHPEEGYYKCDCGATK